MTQFATNNFHSAVTLKKIDLIQFEVFIFEKQNIHWIFRCPVLSSMKSTILMILSAVITLPVAADTKGKLTTNLF